MTPVQSPHSIFHHYLPQLAHRGPTPLSPCMCVPGCFSHVWLSADPWTIAHQAPLSVGFSRQEYWSGWPCLPPGDLPNPGTELASLKSPALAGGFVFKHHCHLGIPSSLYDFLTVAVTSDDKLADLKQHPFIIQFGRLEVWTSGCWLPYFRRLERRMDFLAFFSYRLPTFFGSWPLLPSSKPWM